MASHTDSVNFTVSLSLSLYTESPVPSPGILLDRVQHVNNIPQGKYIFMYHTHKRFCGYII